MSRPDRDHWAMSLAKLTATRGTCLRRSVGCVLLNARGHVLATGYNGVAAGLPHCNDVVYHVSSLDVPGSFVEKGVAVFPEYPNSCPGAHAPSGTALDCCQALHAEQNALLQCRDAWSIDTAYVTASPCITCVKLLMNTSCQRIVFDEVYPHPEAQQLWEKTGRIWQHLDV